LDWRVIPRLTSLVAQKGAHSAQRDSGRGRGDRRGARFVGLAIFAASAIAVLLSHHLLVDLSRFNDGQNLASAAFDALLAWVSYLAFEGDSQVSLIGNIMNTEPAALATLQPLTPPSLERVVKKCLAKAPDDRWDGAHDVADELRWTASSLSPPAGAPAAARHSRRVSLLWWLPTAGLLIALAIALPAALRQWRATPPSPALVRFTIFPLENTTFPAAGGAAEGHRRRARHPDRACRAARSRDHPRDARVARGCALAERPAARVRGRTGPRAAVTWCLHATATRTRAARDDQIAGRWPVRHWRRFPAGSQDPSSKD
jgi:hypothetical protein